MTRASLVLTLVLAALSRVAFAVDDEEIGVVPASKSIIFGQAQNFAATGNSGLIRDFDEVDRSADFPIGESVVVAMAIITIFENRLDVTGTRQLKIERYPSRPVPI